MLEGDQTLAGLRARFAHDGEVRWIGVRPARGEPLVAVREARLVADHGLAGDHRAARAGSRRQVTLIQHEHLDAIAALAGLARLEPGILRRNIVVAGINLAALKGLRFRIGGATLQASGACHPCSRMEQLLGAGGYNAMRGHGGITAVVLEGGAVSLGDAVRALAP